MFTNFPLFLIVGLFCVSKFVNHFILCWIQTSNFLLTIWFSKPKNCRNLPKWCRWTERDLNPRFFDCESNVRTKLNHQPHYCDNYCNIKPPPYKILYFMPKICSFVICMFNLYGFCFLWQKGKTICYLL